LLTYIFAIASCFDRSDRLLPVDIDVN